MGFDFGENALKEEDVGALFKVVGGLCDDLFGKIDLSRSSRVTAEIFNINGEYAKVSRQTIRNTGYVIGSLVLMEYFSPNEEPNCNQIAKFYEEVDDEEWPLDDCFFGKYLTFTFDSTDGSFYRTESLAKLYADEEGVPDIEEVDGSYEQDTEEEDAFANLLENEARTLKIDDYFVVNTIKLLLSKKTV